jgi:hypothetical protein
MFLVIGFTSMACEESATPTTIVPSSSTVTLPENVPGTDGGELDRVLQNPNDFIDQEVTVSGMVVLTFEDDPNSFVMGVPGATMTRGDEDRYFVLVLGVEGVIPADIAAGQTAEVRGNFVFYSGHAIIGRADPLGLPAWMGRPAIVAEEVTIQ